MANIEKLTPEQEANIIPHRDRWLKFILSCENKTDREKARSGIEWLYKFCKKEPPVIIFMDSPYGCQVAANFFKNEKGANIRDNIRDNIGDNIRDNIGDNIGANIRDNIGANIGANIRDNIWANIWDNIGDNIWDNMEFKYHSTGYYGNVSDYGWVAWIDYFFQMGLIVSDKQKDFDNFKELLLSGIFEMIQIDGMCIVSDMPTKIIQNVENRLHNINGSSVEFRDGFYMNHVNGVFIPPALFEKISLQKFTFEDFAKEENEEVKSAILSFFEEKFGNDYLFRFISESLTELDTYTNKKDTLFLEGTTGGMNIGVYTFFKGTINGIDMAFVRCYCPSTDRMFFLSVDPVNSNAKDAIASLYRVPKKLLKEIKYIQRQGERFSTVFSDKGKELLKAMTNEEIADLVSIPGERYFSLMKYEF